MPQKEGRYRGGLGRGEKEGKRRKKKENKDGAIWGVSGEAMMYEGKRALICDISTHDVLNFRSTVRKTNMDRDTYGKPEKHELF